MSGNFIYRHHVEPRVKLYSPGEESVPIPLKYIDVSRTTHTNLDVMQERRIDDYWNIDGSGDLYDPWTGFTQFTLLEEKAPDRIYVVWGERLTRKHPGQIIYGQNSGRQWESMPSWRRSRSGSNENLHLENARKLRGIYFIDPEDKEFKEAIKNARKKLETPMVPAMPCKASKKGKNGATRGKSNEVKSKLACIWTPVNPQECVWKNLYRIIMRTILQERVALHCNKIWYTNFPMPQAMKTPAAKAAVDEEWEVDESQK